MRIAKGIWLGLFLLPGAVPAAREGPPAPANLQETITAARDRVYPALVNISVVMETVNGGRQVRHRGTGSGTILDAEGHVLTNHHVAGQASHVICTLSDKEEIPAEVVGTDAMTDLTVLKLKLSERKNPSAPLPVAVLGDSDGLDVGDYVLAMGSPVGLARSVTLGIVSNKERFFGMGMDLDGEPTGVLTRWIQHDALILPGNSGGPLVNLRGEVIGINELGGTGVGFAIPSNLAKGVLADILRQGHVRRGWLGAYFQPLLKGGAEERGALVSSVEPGSPAADAGLQAGDLLVAFDGAAVTARFDEEIPLLYRRIAETPVGRVLDLSIRREGALRSLKVALGEDEPVRGQEHELRRLGVTARDITRAMARGLHLDDPSGVFLSGVQAGGSAGMAKPPLQGGDVLRSLEGKPIRNVQDLKAWGDALKPDEKRQVLVGVLRQGAQLLSLMKVAPKDEDARGPQVSKAWLGCASQVLTRPLGEALELAEVKGGVRVTQVYPETPAEKAGLQVGDIITQVGNKPVNAFQEGHSEVFGEMIRQRKIGEKTALKILRGKESLEVEVVLDASPVEPKDAPRMRDVDFEFVAREITFQDRVWHRWGKGVSGCVVESVEPSGWAGFAGLNGGDLILSVGGRPVAGLDSLKQVFSTLKDEKPSRVVIMFQRGLHTGYLSVEPQWAE
jgi:serine protease Do